MTALQTPSSGDSEIDLGNLLGRLNDHKWLIGIVTGVFLVASVAYAVLATPVYQANAVVQVEQKVPDLPGLSAITQTLGASSSEATTEIALITSRTVIGKAVDNLKMKITVAPERFPLVGNFLARNFTPTADVPVAPADFGMSRYDWGGAKLDVFQLDVPESLLEKSLTLIAGKLGAFQLLDDKGRLILSGKTGQVASGNGTTIQVKALRANPGTRFDVTPHRDLTVISLLQQNVIATEQGKDSGIIELTYNDPDPGLAVNLLNQISQIYVLKNVERNSEEAANSLRFVRQQLPNVRRDLEKATAALAAYQMRAHSVNITMQTQGLLDQEVAVENSIQQLRMQQADIERRYTPEHPAYKALMSQLAQLEEKKDSMEKMVGALPDTQQELLRLTRDVQVSNDTYTSLLNQAQQLDIARAGTVGNVRIIDSAAVDVTQPVSPKKLIVIFGGTLLGAFLAAVYVFVRQMLNRGIEDPSDIEELGLPVYASIPLSENEKNISVKEAGRRSARDGGQHLLAVEFSCGFGNRGT